MDPITTALVAALTMAGSETVKSATKDAYEGVKGVIRRKWGSDGPLAKAVQGLEEKPKSEGRARTLQEEIAEAKATEDPEVMQEVRRLVEILKKEGIGGEAVAGIKVHISGGSTAQGIIGAQRVNVGDMSFGTLPTPKRE